MSDPMQKFGHRDSPYSRPNTNWQCARADACTHGPSASGKCSLANEACVPSRTVKSKKRLIFIWLLCVAVASLTLFLTATALLTRLSPGPLTLSHAEVAACQDCHAAASKSISGWVTSAMMLDSHNDDQQCLSCHALGDNPFLPHSTKAESFSIVNDVQPEFASSVQWKTALAGEFRNWQNSQSEEISCSACHREHQGELNDVASFDAQQCHTCHTNKFDHIETGHPEYSLFPHSEPSRIQFDHATHLEKHFFEDDVFDIAPEGCTTCHNTDQTGEWMLSNSFEESCSSCHLEDVLGNNRATAKGIAVLAIPELDLQSLNAAGFNVGQWPNWADGEVPPIMRALLTTQTEPAAVVAEALSHSVTLYDLSSATPEQLTAAARLAWEIKQLFYDLQMGGTKVMEQRLSAAFEGTLDQSTLNRLVASLPRDTLVNNQRQWFPTLVDEVKQYRLGHIDVRAPMADQGGKAIDKTLSETRPSSGRDDILSDDDDTLSDDDDILSDDDDILSDDDDILSDDDDILSDDDDILSDDDDILSDDDDILSDDDDILSDDDTTLIAGVGVSNGDNGNDQKLNNQLQGLDPAPADNESWAVTGGWYRDGSTIRYRPADHADLFFKTWLDVSSRQYEKIDESLFESMSSEKAVGNCTKCHSIAQSADKPTRNVVMHWQSFKPNDVNVDFNRFSHVSHFSLMTNDGCTSCHALNQESLDGVDSTSLLLGSGFENIERATCTQCHQRGRAPDNCLTCHNYHAEPHEQSIEKMSDSLINEARDTDDE